jgi:integrase
MDDNHRLIEDYVQRYRGRTRKDYRREIQSFYIFVEKDLPEVEKQDIEGYLTELKKKKTATTVQRIYHQLATFYHELYKNEKISSNPFFKVQKPKASKQVKKDRVPSFQELERLLRVLREEFSLRDYAMVLLISTTGIRLKEALHIKWSDFFLDGRDNLGLRVQKGSYDRYVKIYPEVWEVLERYRKEVLKVEASYLKEDYYIFISRNDREDYRRYADIIKPLSESWLRPVLVAACKKAEIPLYTAKDLRHANAMHALKLGASTEEIQQQLGWNNKNFVNRYNGVIASLEKSANDYTHSYFTRIINEETDKS